MKNLFVSLCVAATLIAPVAAQKQVVVTPASGESWLSHLHRALGDTSMGKTGRLGPPTAVPTRLAAEQSAKVQRLAFDTENRSVSLQGADLYRLNCRGCHGEQGLGAPPEINSVISATRATSASLTIERMKERGLDTSWTQANELAKQAKGTLLERLHKGGVDMPPFPHLSEVEVHAIFAYLRQLAEIPGAERQQVHLEEAPVRVGEHVVKSTCHICHSAVGMNPSPDELMQGAIPPLSTLTARVSLAEFERKVRHGAPIMMGTPLLPYRGRMPVFDYLSETEIADAYLYLKLYPPTAWSDPVNPPSPPQTASAIAAIVSRQDPPNPPNGEAGERKASILPVLAVIIVGLLLGGGATYTFREVKRSKAPCKSMKATADAVAASPASVMPIPSPAMSTVKSSPLQQSGNKQAAWRSRFNRSEYHVFESSWLARRWKNEDGAA